MLLRTESDFSIEKMKLILVVRIGIIASFCAIIASFCAIITSFCASHWMIN